MKSVNEDGVINGREKLCQVEGKKSYYVTVDTFVFDAIDHLNASVEGGFVSGAAVLAGVK